MLWCNDIIEPIAVTSTRCHLVGSFSVNLSIYEVGRQSEENQTDNTGAANRKNIGDVCCSLRYPSHIACSGSQRAQRSLLITHRSADDRDNPT